MHRFKFHPKNGACSLLNRTANTSQSVSIWKNCTNVVMVSDPTSYITTGRVNETFLHASVKHTWLLRKCFPIWQSYWGGCRPPQTPPAGKNRSAGGKFRAKIRQNRRPPTVRGLSTIGGSIHTDLRLKGIHT